MTRYDNKNIYLYTYKPHLFTNISYKIPNQKG